LIVRIVQQLAQAVNRSLKTGQTDAGINRKPDRMGHARIPAGEFLGWTDLNALRLCRLTKCTSTPAFGQLKPQKRHIHPPFQLITAQDIPRTFNVCICAHARLCGQRIQLRMGQQTRGQIRDRCRQTKERMFGRTAQP
jgi:hypothetical protein